VVEDDIPLYRRRGGGCAVVLDPGTLVVSVAFPAQGYLDVSRHFDRALAWLIQGLDQCGIPGLYRDGISDIVLNNRKVGGTCFYRARGLALFSASLLVCADLSLMERYLTQPSRQPTYRKQRSHAEFTANLGEFHPGLSVHGLSERLTGLLDPGALSS